MQSSWQSKTTIALEEIFSSDKTTIHAPLKPAFDLKPLTIIRRVFQAQKLKNYLVQQTNCQ